MRQGRRANQATWGSFSCAIACGGISAASGGVLLAGAFRLLPRTLTDSGGLGGGVNLYAVVVMLVMPLILVVAAPIGTIAGVLFLRDAILWEDRFRYGVIAGLAGCGIGWAGILVLAAMLAS